MEGFYALKAKVIWKDFLKEHFSFWMICGYLFVEYVRPQSIVPAIDFLPWAQVFLLAAIGSWMADRSAKWVADPVNKWMILFYIVIILSSLLAYYPDMSREHWKDFYGWLLIYFAIINIVTNEKRLFIFLCIFMLASFKISLHGAKTWTLRGFAFTDWGLNGPPGYFQNSGELAIQMLMFAPISYKLAMAFRPALTKVKFYGFLLLPLTAAMTVMGASSRGGQIALIAQLYHTFLKGRINFKTILLVGALVAAGYHLMPEEQLKRFQTAGSDKTSEQRLLYWKNGVEMVKDHPLLGIGFYNFVPYYEAHYRHDLLYPTAQLPHNIFVQIATDTGLLGLGIYLIMIVKSFRTTAAVRKLLADKKDHWLYGLSQGLDAAFIGFLIAGQFVTVGYYPFMWINLAFVVALKHIVTKNYANTNPRG